MGNVKYEKLSGFADLLFQIDGAVPALSTGGHLRALVDAAAGTLIMNYGPRQRDGVAPLLLEKMRAAYADVWAKGDPDVGMKFHNADSELLNLMIF